MKMPVLGEEFNGGSVRAATCSAAPDDRERRAVLIGLPLAAAALAVPLVTKASEETPVLRLFREWQALNDRIDAFDGDTPDTMLEELSALELRLRITPSVGVADFAAKVAAFTHWGHAVICEDYAPEIWAEARMMLEKVQ
ncbi:hypothetical protein DWF04_015835 [Cereibacter sphaeroides f. sp. denitrificans]|nr:hypothetical protein DWF04_16090 [Cereibacter sphaeroides f. sp. denitrificans]